MFVLRLTTISLEHKRTFALRLVSQVDQTRTAFVAVIRTFPIFAPGPVKTGLTHTINLTRNSGHFALAAVETSSVTAIRLAMRSCVS